MKKNKIKLWIVSLLMAAVLVLSACGGTQEAPGDNNNNNGGEEEIVKTWETIGADDSLIERPRVDDETTRELLTDLNFSRGFSVTAFHSNTSGGVPFGYLDYAGKKAAGDPVWSVGQWGCTKNMVDGEFTREGTVLGYDDGGKVVRVDATKTGKITVGVKGSVEYGADEDGKYLDRENMAQNWPHNIIGQSVNSEFLAGSKRLMMEADYTVTEYERLVTEAADPELHAAQFQWFITLSDRDPQSESYGQTMWFGFSMFDSRSMNKCPPGMAAYDGGKEDSTGLYIYMFSLDSVDQTKTYNHVDKPTSVAGQRIKVSVDILPYIQMGLTSAAKKGAMKGASWEKLKIGSTNIGWEIPGSYDVSVDIHQMNMYQVF